MDPDPRGQFITDADIIIFFSDVSLNIDKTERIPMFFTNMDISLRITDLDPGGQLITYPADPEHLFFIPVFREFYFIILFQYRPEAVVLRYGYRNK
jgi:hypothetical protein